MSAKKPTSKWEYHLDRVRDGQKSPPGLVGPHGLSVRPRGLKVVQSEAYKAVVGVKVGSRGVKVVQSERKCLFLSEYIKIILSHHS